MATRKSNGAKRPSGGVQVSRWASLLFAGLVLLFIGILIGMQIAAQHPRAVSEVQKPAPRIVVTQPPQVVAREAPVPAPRLDPPPVAKVDPSPPVAKVDPSPPVAKVDPSPLAARPDAMPAIDGRLDAELDRIELEAAKPRQPVVPPIPALPPQAAQPNPAPPPATVAERIVPPSPPQVTPASLALPSAGSGWRKFAVAPPRTDGRAMIAVVIDDLGVDRKRSERIVALPAPLTTAFMSYAKDLPRLTATARAKGHELMLHMPMEPTGASYDAGPAGEVLTVGLAAADIRRRVAEGLGRFEGMIGLNNHMGSRFTADSAGMKIVMEELAKRGLMFLDSVTTQHSVGSDEARRHGVAVLARDVFIDNEETLAAVTAQLHKTEQVARKQGYAVAIGHPHDATIDALTAWLPTLKDKGLVLVPISAILRRQYPSG